MNLLKQEQQYLTTTDDTHDFEVVLSLRSATQDCPEIGFGLECETEIDADETFKNEYIAFGLLLPDKHNRLTFFECCNLVLDDVFASDLLAKFLQQFKTEDDLDCDYVSTDEDYENVCVPRALEPKLTKLGYDPAIVEQQLVALVEQLEERGEF